MRILFHLANKAKIMERANLYENDTGIPGRVYRAQNEAYKIEKTKKWEKSMNDRELER